MLGVQRFFFAEVRKSAGLDVKKSGGSLLCLLALNTPTDASFFVFLSKNKNNLSEHKCSQWFSLQSHCLSAAVTYTK